MNSATARRRSATGDELVRMNRARKMSLDEALEFVREDECVEVTPDAIRLRKSILKAGERHTARGRAKSLTDAIPAVDGWSTRSPLGHGGAANDFTGV